MKFYYSPTTTGFYTDVLQYPDFPDDAIELTEEKYNELLTGMSVGSKEIVLLKGSLSVVDKEIVVTWEDIRRKRDGLLKQSDFTQMPDYPGDKVAWASYRQQLRDLPSTQTDPNNITWPEKPS